jgi:hypothetical protein
VKNGTLASVSCSHTCPRRGLHILAAGLVLVSPSVLVIVDRRHNGHLSNGRGSVVCWVNVAHIASTRQHLTEPTKTATVGSPHPTGT